MIRKKKNFRFYALETIYLGEEIDLKRLQNELKKYRCIKRGNPAILKIQDNGYAIVTQFGTVTFWNVRKDSMRRFMEEAAPFAKSFKTNYGYTDKLKIYVGGEKERATAEKVVLRELNTEKIKIISYVSAQSVALDRYENDINERMKKVGKVLENLKSSGRTRFSQKNLLKEVGFILLAKQNIISNLALLDKPDEAWESPEIESLYDRLRSEYDLKDRLAALNEKMKFLSENNVAFLNFIAMKKSNLLSVIIIILIALFILLFLPDYTSRFIKFGG